MSKLLRIAAVILPAVLLLVHAQPGASPFLEKPYLQLGDNPLLTPAESLMLLWHTDSSSAPWTVELQSDTGAAWRATPAPVAQSVAVQGIAPHLVYRAKLTGLVPGKEFRYRVLKAGAVVFESTAMARKSATQAQRFVLFGDCAQGTPAERAVAYQASLAKPDYIMIPGDIVYSSGRISEYRAKFFPVYNVDQASAEAGAPLLRSTPFIAAPGNHDTALTNFQKFPDALAYFLYWDQPLNGPAAPAGTPKGAHVLNSTPEAEAAFLAPAQGRYPVMANFSFDYGNAHWTVLDSNPYMDWSQPALRDWVAKDLASAQSATWRFVAFHHPGFNSAKTHFTDQWMRRLSPVFEAGKVDIVFMGHVHNYQRSFPLTFEPKPQADGAPMGPRGEVTGDWKLDKNFADGAKSGPQGVIYIVSGGGGAGLYNPEQQADKASWQPFTDKFVSEHNSFSVVEIEGRKFSLKQVSDTGATVDAFRINK